MPAKDNSRLESLIKNRKDSILTLMGFTVFPYVSTSSLSIDSAESINTSLQQTTLGGGATISQDFLLYLEGTAGHSRSSPTFTVYSRNEKPHLTLGHTL